MSCVSSSGAAKETLDDAVCDHLQVTFEQMGLTPGDQFWVYVCRTTHLRLAGVKLSAVAPASLEDHLR